MRAQYATCLSPCYSSFTAFHRRSPPFTAFHRGTAVPFMECVCRPQLCGRRLHHPRRPGDHLIRVNGRAHAKRPCHISQRRLFMIILQPHVPRCPRRFPTGSRRQQHRKERQALFSCTKRSAWLTAATTTEKATATVSAFRLSTRLSRRGRRTSPA